MKQVLYVLTTSICMYLCTRLLNIQYIFALSIFVILTLNDVSQALGQQQVPETRHLILELPHQAVAWIFVDHGVAADLLGSVCVPVGRGGGIHSGERTSSQVLAQLDVSRGKAKKTTPCK